MKVVILMSRLSDYMLNCFTAWQQTSGVDIHIVRRNIDAGQAPFDFLGEFANLVLYDREAMTESSIQALIHELQPGLIICFGWFDKPYLSTVRTRPADTRAVMTMDNQWHATLRQVLGIGWARLVLRGLFDFIWVPGPRQHRFARLLGFTEPRICEGLYVANRTKFTPIRASFADAPIKRLVYVGRYIEAKGLRELWEGFEAYHARVDSSLELLCIGTGPLEAERPEHPRIRHLGFVQPKDFGETLAGGGVFILPSHFEPWGVVVHEFALAGFPLILSRQVGAGDLFLHPDNGILLDEVTPEAITAAITKIDALDAPALVAMSKASAACGEELTVEDWCAQADAFLPGGGA